MEEMAQTMLQRSGLPSGAAMVSSDIVVGAPLCSDSGRASGSQGSQETHFHGQNHLCHPSCFSFSCQGHRAW